MDAGRARARARRSTLIAALTGCRITPWGARTRAEHLTWASILGTRALPSCLPAHGPAVQLAGAARAATCPKTWRSWCCGTRSRSCPVRSPSRSRTGLTPCGDRRLGAAAAQAPSPAPDRDTRHPARLAPAPGQGGVSIHAPLTRAGSNKRVSLVDLIAVKPGHTPPADLLRAAAAVREAASAKGSPGRTTPGSWTPRTSTSATQSSWSGTARTLTSAGRWGELAAVRNRLIIFQFAPHAADPTGRGNLLAPERAWSVR